MPFEFSRFGERFARSTGALELMDDLGHAMSGEHPALMLGGGNPGKIPAIQRIVRQRLAEVAANEAELERMLSNYAHPKGEVTFRRALARLFKDELGWPLTEDNVALTAGSQAGFFLLFNLFAGEHGDGRRRRILLPVTPEYVGYADVCLDGDLLTARRSSIEELPGRSFKYHVDFANLAVDDEIAAVCVSRPCNPTGNVLTDAEVEALDGLCRERGVPLIVDAAYGAPFPNIVFCDARPFWNENVVVCMSLSKLGLPGVRTGIVIAPETIVEALTSMTAVLNLAVGSVGPVLAQPWVESGEIVAMSRRHIAPYYREKAQRAREWLERALDGVPFRIHEPEGAFFLWLWLPGLPITSAELYGRLKASNVLVLSGHYFFPGLAEPWAHRDECLRISYAQDDDVVRRGIEVMAAEIRSAFDGANTRA